MTTNGIAGMRGRDPIGAALTIGVKDSGRGFPIEKDRFHLVQPREVDGRRPVLPQFAKFNSAAPEKRRYIRGNIMHATQEECFQYRLRNQAPKGKGHPGRRPFCEGDGVTALRWMGGDADNFKAIECPHDLCEYRQSTPPMCKPFMRLIFRIRWPDNNPLPTPLTKFTSGSWNTTDSFVGFFRYVLDAAHALGMSEPSLIGFPFSLQLNENTRPQKRFPVVVVTPEADPIEWFAWQRERMAELTSGPRPAAITDESEQDPIVLDGDYQTISVPAS